MKKFFLCVAVFLICVSAGAQSICAISKELSAEISMSLKQNKFVSDATVLVFGEFCAIGLQTKDIVTKTSKNEFLEKVEKDVLEQHSKIKKVFVTTNIRKIVKMKEIERRLKNGENEMNLLKEFFQK